MKNILLIMFLIILSGCASTNWTHQNSNNSKLTELVITNSINNQDILSNGNKIRSIDVSTLLGEAIKRISEESSVSSLFDF